MKKNENVKTQVEVFLIEETRELIYDADKLKEWEQLTGELGLAGQRTLAVPDRSPIPYLHMKQSLQNMFTVLCPVKVDIKEYNVTPIPLEILRLASLSVREKHFQQVEIWYDDKKPDPVCVGITGYWEEGSYQDGRNKELSGKIFSSKQECVDAGAKYPWFRENNKYLIGRWADEKREFSELKEMAREIMFGVKLSELNVKKKKVQRELDELEDKVRTYLEGEYTIFDYYF
jgi:hypothetical protein